MPMRSVWRAVPVAAALPVLLAAASAAAQPSDRQRLGNDNVVCLDHCDAEFQRCAGPPPAHGPLTPIRPGNNGTVNTPPPYEQCLLNRDICVAQCQLSLATARQRASARRAQR